MAHIRDPIHGDINISPVQEIVDHPLFQRLRRISQLSLAWMVYPSAHHTRFEHSIGVYYISSHIDERLSVYGLLHDVGHGPFSHLTEIALSLNGYPFDHEKYTEHLVKEMLENSTFSWREILRNKDNILVDGGVGTDRLDYLVRDSYFTGVRVGIIPWERIIRHIEAEKGKIIIKEDILSNVEHLYVARFILGDAVYFHRTTLIVDMMFARAVGELLNHYSAKEIQSMDEYSIVSALRSINSKWWDYIENRRLYKLVFKGSEEEAREVYETLSERYGEDNVILGHRPAFYSRPDVFLEDGRSLLEASPLIRSLKRAEESRIHWFVAVHPSLRKDIKELSTSVSKGFTSKESGYSKQF